MENRVYSLRIYDRELMRFVMEKRGMKGLVVEIRSVKEETRHLLPLDMECTGEGVLKWLKRRVIPRNRTFAGNILWTLGLGPWDTKGIIDVSKGLSLNDSYWIVPEDFDGKFAHYSLYRNPFSEKLARVAFTGEAQGEEEFTISPELTTHGMLPKAWRITENNGICLYKGGDRGAFMTGREPYCEFYACQIAERMGLNAVHYDLETWEGMIASSCTLFTDEDTSFTPIGRLVKTGDIFDCVEYCDDLGPEYGEQIRSMLVFDALIYNYDRHFGNFGLLRDNRTGKIKAPAPIFDNGLSLMCHAGKAEIEDFEKLLNYSRAIGTPYQVSFEDVCAAVMGEKQKEQLSGMIGFTFRRHPENNLPEEHLKALEKLLEIRVRKLLEIPLGEKAGTWER